MSEPSTATHTVWCGTDHDPAENGCLTAPVRFPALGVTVWMGETSTGPQVVFDPPLAGGPPETMQALLTWVGQLSAQPVTP
jgi:hypothetical protein